VTVPAYLGAVRQIHGVGLTDMARALRVSPSVVRRWARGGLVPSWRHVRTMTSVWGGDADVLALGAALQRFSRTTGVRVEDAVHMIRSGRRTAPQRGRTAVLRDRRQLALPIVP